MNDLGFLWWLIPLCLLAPWLLWPLLDLIRHLYYEEKADKSYRDFCSSCPSVVIVTGMMGAGKSSLQSGFVNLSVIEHQQTCMETVDEVRKIFSDLDFHLVNSLVQEMVLQQNCNPVRFLEKLYQTDPSMKQYLSGTYDVYTDVRRREDVMCDYFDAMFALLNNNYVFSDNRFYSRVTENLSYPTDMGFLEIKDRFVKKDWALPPHSTILIDEASLYYGKNDYASVAREDKGLATGFKLERHLSGEHLRIIMTSQNFADVTKELRSLSLGQFDVEGFDSVRSRKISWPFVKLILDLVLVFIEWVQGWHVRLAKEKERDDASFDSKPLARQWLKVNGKIMEISSRDFLLFKGSLYTEFDSSGHPVKDISAPFSYLIPVHFCWGSTDRFAFGFVRRKLNEVSVAKLGRSSFNRSQEENADDLLTPRLVKKEKEKEVRSSSYDRSLDPWMQQ